MLPFKESSWVVLSVQQTAGTAAPLHTTGKARLLEFELLVPACADTLSLG